MTTYSNPKADVVINFGFAVFSIDYSGNLNNFATLPSGNPRGVYLINGEKVFEDEWIVALRNAEDIARLAGAQD